MSDRDNKGKRVLIVGAGIAGMVSALRLKEIGYDVTILEASERPGGRIHTLRGFSDGLYAEGGATYIPGVHNLTNDYLKHYDIALNPIPEERLFTYWHIGGRKVRVGADNENWPVELSERERKMGLVGMMEHYIGSVVSDLKAPDDPNWSHPDMQRYDEMSYAGFLRKQGASEGAIALMRRIFPDIHGEGIEDVSALFCLRDFLNEGGGWSTITGGSEKFPLAMARDLGSIIHYGAPVNLIEHNGDEVSVRYVQAGQERWLHADKIVLALQFSALRMIEITPLLSPEKVSAISQLGHSSVSRVFLQMRERYWGDDGPEYMGISDTAALGIRDASYALPGKRGLIECYIPGAVGRQISALDLSGQIEMALGYVEQVLPGARDAVELGASKCWDTDPYARGGYAYYRPGEMKSLMPMVSQSEGVLHFAGDHTSPWPSWIQGAIHSAHRVVSEISSPIH